MKKKINIQEEDFELYLDNTLKSYGYLFPETDEQISVFEKNIEIIPILEELESPDIVFEGIKRIFTPTHIPISNSEGENNWALAARDGKDIPNEILEKMKRDKENARKKLDENK